jgi:NADH dehydrogenase (ubiquinone) Fe-S protein 5
MSGFGYNGGRSRCHEAFVSFMECYAGADETKQCVAQKEDYLECLHRTKEVNRAKEIKAHFAQSQAAQGADARKAAEKAASGVIANLGLVHEAS